LQAHRALRFAGNSLVAGQRGPGQPESRGVEIYLTRGLVVLGLVGARINLKKQIVLLHFRAFAVRHFGQVAGHARPDIHRIDRHGASRELPVVGDLPLHGLADRQRGRLIIRHSDRRAVTAA